MTTDPKAPDREAIAPLEAQRGQRTVRTGSGRSLDELTIEALRAGRLTAEDFRISREQLDEQAAAAEAGGYRQLAESLRRAAELTGLPNERVFEIYNMLRPGRATAAELTALASQLEGQNLPRVAAFILEAAAAYARRGIAKR
jgi:propanediol dehydratase small subunit